MYKPLIVSDSTNKLITSAYNAAFNTVKKMEIKLINNKERTGERTLRLPPVKNLE